MTFFVTAAGRSRGARLALLGTLWALGCNDPQTSTTTDGSGGNGGGDMTGSAGNGGGGDMTGSAGNGGGGDMTGSGGGGGSPTACEVLCGGSCDGSVCTTTEEANLAVTVIEWEIFGDAPEAIVMACFHEKTVRRIEVMAADGGCALYASTLLEGSSDSVPFSGGTLTVNGATTGLLTLPAAGASKCQEINLSGNPSANAFAPGETITAKGTGGVDVPPFSLQVTAPEALTLTATPLKAGEPMMISWTPSAPPNAVVFLLPSGLFLSCSASAPDSLVVPGSMTALLDDSSGGIALLVARSTVAKTSSGGSGPEVHLSAFSEVLEIVATQ